MNLKSDVRSIFDIEGTSFSVTRRSRPKGEETHALMTPGCSRHCARCSWKLSFVWTSKRFRQLHCKHTIKYTEQTQQFRTGGRLYSATKTLTSMFGIGNMSHSSTLSMWTERGLLCPQDTCDDKDVSFERSGESNRVHFPLPSGNRKSRLHRQESSP